MRSKTAAIDPVRPAMRATRASCSPASRAQRSAQRACSSRSGQLWHGCARSRRRRAAISASSSRRTPTALRPVLAGGSAAVADRGPQGGGEVATRGGHPRGEALRHAQEPHGAHAGADVRDGELAHLAVDGEHRRLRPVETGVAARVDDDGVAGPAADRDLQHVTDPQALERARHLGPAGGRLGARQVLLAGRDLAPQRGVLGEVALVARHRAGVPLQGLCVRPVPAARGRPRPGRPGTARRTSRAPLAPGPGPPARPG